MPTRLREPSLLPLRPSRLHRSRGLALLVALALLLAPGPSVATTGPRTVIQQTVDDVLAILRDDTRSEEQRRAELEAIAHARFDFQTMARLVLARSWKKLSDEQQGQFVDEFTQYLANDYGQRLERYEQESVEVLGEQSKTRGDVVVKSRIVGGDQSGAEIDYRLRERDGAWRIIDVVIEGISLVANFRDQFREVMGRDGPDVLLDRLREKNAKGETTL